VSRLINKNRSINNPKRTIPNVLIFLGDFGTIAANKSTNWANNPSKIIG
jgi:hypothetical protein